MSKFWVKDEGVLISKSGICYTKPAISLRRSSLSLKTWRCSVRVRSMNNVVQWVRSSWDNWLRWSQSYYKVSIETRARLINCWQNWRPNVNFGLLLGTKKLHNGYRTLFFRARRNLATLGVWPIETYSANFVNFGQRVSWHHAATCISPSLIHL